ncbi:MAG: acyl carrier protein [Coriobacteriaceae bacterium]|nr:acyl carrier protein [Coriobacteriaceae bacterium]
MERIEIMERVGAIAADVLGIDPEEISEETTFDDLDADSLDRLQLVTAMEDEFDIEIPDEQLEAIGSVADAVQAIESVLEA